MRVRCDQAKDSEGGDVGLTIGRVYEVLAIEADWYRLLMDETDPLCPNEPLLFDPSCFSIVDDEEPACWVMEMGDDGDRYAGPERWGRVGFFEDFFDGDASAREQFWNDVRELFPWTWQQRFLERR